MKKIICLSDTHSLEYKVPNEWLVDADIAIHGGDCTNIGRMNELKYFLDWYSSLDRYKHKIFIAGNHDWCFERNYNESIELLSNYPQLTYLQDEEIVIDGIKIYGSPHQPEFGSWAFNQKRGKEIQAKWDLIPKDTDILVTHGPPFGIGDFVPYRGGEFVGCKDLASTILTLPNLKAHIFGHIHYSYGSVYKNNIQYINAATCNEGYEIVNKPIVIEI